MFGIKDTLEFVPINIAILTVSDSRSLHNDTSGQILADSIQMAGHKLIKRSLLNDDIDKIIHLLKSWISDEDIDVVITVGGTGLTGRDITPEAFDAISEKEIVGFGELFRWVSFESIGTSTIQSRAKGVIAMGKYLFALPGSNGAVRDGWNKILRFQLDNRHRPCNFVELIPRLNEK